jgi:hypothetical protein
VSRRRRSYSFRLPLLVAVLAASAGCMVEDQGLPYDRLRIAVSRSDSTSVAGFPRCLTLPVLNGSVVEERYSIEGGLEVEVFATNGFVGLSFSGASQGASVNRTISVERLRAGYAESLEVTNPSGTAFTIGLGSGCSDGDIR